MIYSKLHLQSIGVHESSRYGQVTEFRDTVNFNVFHILSVLSLRGSKMDAATSQVTFLSI